VIRSLRDYLSYVEGEGGLLRIRIQVVREDLPELIERLSRKGKVILFEHVRGYECSVVANLLPSHEFLRVFLGGNDPYGCFLERIRGRARKNVQDVRAEYTCYEGDGLDLLEILPILHHYEEDSGPFITSAITSALDPETGVVARGVHRMEYRGKNRVGIALLNPPLAQLFQRFEKEGKCMPVSIAIGVDPLVFLSIALRLPPDVDKLEVAGALKGGEIDVMPSFSLPLDLPFAPEVVLEGYVDGTEKGRDGPLGEVSGYYFAIDGTPTVVVERVFHKEDFIFHALLPTSDEANTYLTFVSQAHMGRYIFDLFPYVKDLSFARGTFGSSLFVRVGPARREAVKNLILFLLSLPMIKKVIVVDEDVDLQDKDALEWSFVTRVTGKGDVLILQGLGGQPILPEVRRGEGVTKIGIDATASQKGLPKRAKVRKGDEVRIQELLKSIGGLT